MAKDWRVIIDDTGGPDTGWPFVCSDIEDRCVIHVNGFNQECVAGRYGRQHRDRGYWWWTDRTRGPTKKEALEIANLVADYMNNRD